MGGFLLGVVLLASVGWCMVQESSRQTRARYQLADLARREGELHRRLDKLRAEEEELRSPPRLTALVRDGRLQLVALGSAMPKPKPAAGAARQGRPVRLPGQILDADFEALAPVGRMVAYTGR